MSRNNVFDELETFVKGDERLCSIYEPVQLRIVHLRSSTTLGTQDPVDGLVTKPVDSTRETHLIRSPDTFDKDSILALVGDNVNGL